MRHSVFTVGVAFAVLFFAATHAVALTQTPRTQPPCFPTSLAWLLSTGFWQ